MKSGQGEIPAGAGSAAPAVFGYGLLKELRVPLTVGFLMLYALLAPMGNLARFGTAEAALGSTSLLMVFVLLLNGIPAIQALRRHWMLFSIALLVAWLGITTVLSENIPESFGKWVGLLLYLLFAGAVFSQDWTTDRVRRLLLFFVLGASISALLTIIDWVGFTDIPRINEIEASTRTEFGNIPQVTGAFSRRTAMAIYYSLLIPIASLLFLQKSWAPLWKRMGFLLAGLLCTANLLLSHNRSGIISVVAVTTLIALLAHRSPSKALRIAWIGILLSGIIAWVIYTFFYNELIAYQALLRIGGARSADLYHEESDLLRLMFLRHSLNSLLVNPAGNGYSLITGTPGHPQAWDPHGNITQILWGAGIAGILWMLAFAAGAFRRFRVFFLARNMAHPQNPFCIALVAGLCGWLLNGLPHTTIDTGVAWMFFGILLKVSLSSEYRRAAPDFPGSEETRSRENA